MVVLGGTTSSPKQNIFQSANLCFLFGSLAVLGRIQVLFLFHHQGGVLVGVQKVGGSLLLTKMLLTMWKFVKNLQRVISAVVWNQPKER